MKTILIIYPHWPPSNLAGVHRARLIANFLPNFGWNPLVLTVHPDYYEEKHDWDLLKTVSPKIEVLTVKAIKVRKPRIVGDIGLRGYFQLKKAALKQIKERPVDFIWIPIPSFYMALLGRQLHEKTLKPYGIDYIDPWVRDISNRKGIRSLLSIFAAKILEPYAIKKAALISGVAEAYFKPAIKRNFKNKQPVQVAMPYGFDPNDHLIKLDAIQFPWSNCTDCLPFIYAGAFLPKSGFFIDLLFKALASLVDKGIFDKRIRLYFIGTGNYSHKSITDYAVENSVDQYVVEIRDRFPFLHILNFLSAAKGVLLIGSTEKHYTASKTFQVILSGKPVFAILHAQSTAVDIFNESRAADFLVEYHENDRTEDLLLRIKETFITFINQLKMYNPDLTKLENYSSKESARALVKAIEQVI
jgi:hypothetical protein